MSRARLCAMLLVVVVVASATEMTPLRVSVEKSSKAAKTIQTEIPSQCQDSDDADQISSQETGDKRKPPTAEFLRSCADAFRKEGDWTKAERYYQSALLQDHGAGDHSLAEALDLAGVGHAEVRLGNPVKAQDYYQQALAIQEKLAPDSLSMARSLNGLGEATARWGDVAKAERYFHQAQTILRKLGHRGELDFAVSLNGLGSATQQRGHLAEAEILHRQALSIQVRLAPHTLDIADSLDLLGRVSYLQSHYQKAEDYYTKSLALRKQFAGGGLDIAWSIDGLGNVAYDRTKLGEAEGLYRRALAIAEELAPDSLVVGKFLTHLFLVAYDRGNLATADDYQQKALAIQIRLAPDSVDIAASLKNLGNVRYRRGEFAKAEEYGNAALAIREKLIPSSPVVASSLALLGIIADERGDLVKAENYFLRALTIRRKLDPVSLGVAYNFNSLGAVAHSRGDLVQAREYYRRALRLKKKILPGSPEVANSLINLAFLAEDLGDRMSAERYCRQALAIKQKLVPDSLAFATNLNAMSQIVFGSGDLREAEIFQRRALSIRQRSNPDSIETANSLHFLGVILRAQGKLLSAEDFQREALAIQEKLVPGTANHADTLAALAAIMRDRQQWDTAAQLYQRCLGSLENQIAHLGGGHGRRSGFRAKYAHVYQEYTSLLMQQGKTELAFEISDKWRARSLLEMLAEAKIDVRKGADAQLLEQERRLQKSWLARSNARLRLLSGRPTEGQISAANQEIDELSRQHQKLQEQIREASPEYSDLIHPRTVIVSEVQQLLDAGTFLLEYSLGEERSFLWVVGAREFTSYELPKRADIEGQARQIYRLLTAPSQMPPGETQAQRRARLEKARKSYWKASASLSRMILGPASAQLVNRRLLIVSDGALQYIPFAALPEPDSPATGSGRINPPLIVQHEIAHLPSASILAALRAEAVGRKKLPGAVAVLADAVFSKGDTRVEKRGKRQNRNLPTISGQGGINFSSTLPFARSINNPEMRQRGGIRLTRLPFSREEAAGIMAVTAARKGLEALDFNANLALATNPKLGQYRIVHFATHGIVNSENPELSGLVFSLVDREGRPQNGFLDLQSIYNLNLPVDLVVLSACETALGKEIQGEGLVGLTRGFMYAGALQVIASLWKIDDARTAELMRWFYKGVELEELQPIAALRKAQLKLWKQHPQDLPFYWATFHLQGD
jgi:CHAT domain-containing protein/Tfp pilus assembly protein PilF